MLSFKKWLSKQVVIGSDVTYNTANDIIADNNFPESVCKFVMLDYLEKNADDNTIVAFDTCIIMTKCEFAKSNM